MNEEQSAKFSQKLQDIAKAPKYRGAIFQIEADEKGLALVDVKEASLKVYLMIDPECDKILETRFFTYGGPLFTALADSFCRKIQMATVDDACKITAESLEEELRDTPDVRAIPEDALEIKQMNTLISKILLVYPEKKATAIIVREKMERIKYRTQTAEGRAEADAEWNALTKAQKIEKIEAWLHQTVRGTLRADSRLDGRQPPANPLSGRMRRMRQRYGRYTLLHRRRTQEQCLLQLDCRTGRPTCKHPSESGCSRIGRQQSSR